MSAGWSGWGWLAALALALEVVFVALAFGYTTKLVRQRAVDGGDDLRGYQTAIRKLRRGEPMTGREIEVARRIIAIRRHPLAYSIPAAFMTVGVFYILGSMEYLHGARPSERTFLGVVPMFTSTSLIIRMRRTAVLHRRLPARTEDDGDQVARLSASMTARNGSEDVDTAPR